MTASDENNINISMEYQDLPISSIMPDPNQPRKTIDPESLNELAESIKEHGVLQPILVRRDNDKIIIVAGERRYQAARMADFEKIPAIFTDGKPAEIALVENIMREDLTALEEARGMDRLRKEMDYSNKKIAQVLGKSESIISETLSILELPPNVLKELESLPKTPKRELIKIARLENNKQMAGAWRRYKNQNQIGKDEEKDTQDETKVDQRKDQAKKVFRFAKSVAKVLEEVTIESLSPEDKKTMQEELAELSRKIAEIQKKLRAQPK